jgi:hypothetical protein
MIRVGLLYDSISDNLGDKAIGVSMQQFCKDQDFDYEIINPFNFQPTRYSAVIVGGGALIRDPGDDFYDLFRVKGKYILNTVGITATKPPSYLQEYAYVSVRSKQDKHKLGSNLANSADVVPCTSMLMQGKPTTLTKITEGKVGIHVVTSTLLQCGGIENIINSIEEPKVFVSFTRYNYDKSLMKQVFDLHDDQIIDTPDPQEMFSAIGKLNFLITASLHATIFAYVQNIPFITFKQEKVENFLSDRGLLDRMFANTEELKTKILDPKLRVADYTNKIIADKKILKSHTKKLVDVIKNSSEEKLDNTPLQVTNISKEQVNKIYLSQLNHVINDRDLLIHQKLAYTWYVEKMLQQKDQNIQMLNGEIAAIYNSRSWRFVTILKKLFLWHKIAPLLNKIRGL